MSFLSLYSFDSAFAADRAFFSIASNSFLSNNAFFLAAASLASATNWAELASSVYAFIKAAFLLLNWSSCSLYCFTLLSTNCLKVIPSSIHPFSSASLNSSLIFFCSFKTDNSKSTAFFCSACHFLLGDINPNSTNNLTPSTVLVIKSRTDFIVPLLFSIVNISPSHADPNNVALAATVSSITPAISFPAPDALFMASVYLSSPPTPSVKTNNAALALSPTSS